jgi:4-hydroxythreonine-4-phosphate dehydrogenase
MNPIDPVQNRPLIALAMGDPAGISPELTARLLTDPDVLAAADLIVIGDARVLADGAAVAGVTPDVEMATGFALPRGGRPVFLDAGHLDPAQITRGVASKEGGAFALANYRAGIDFAVEGRVQAVCFTPFNKAAMRLANPDYGDDIVYTTAVLGLAKPASEFNILGRLWNARVTSHVSLSEVASLITQKAVLEGIRLTDASMRKAGFATPRIAVAALNPHAGDGGNFGREEIEVIAPAVAQAQAAQIRVEGPYPSDTVFLRARNGAFDAVLTMYHDQGQIAMKLMGFERGVTFLGGFPFPICTPAHGTAYEIAGKGVADPGAARAAVLLAAEMAVARMRQAAQAAD